MTLAHLRVDALYPHEKVDPETLERTIDAIRKGELLDANPILIDRMTNVILDGHHRHEACKRLGIEMIPCLLVDYEFEVELESRRPELRVTKDEVIRRALAGDLFPPKSTRHTFSYLQ